jgi:aryl-alcohol dehydrogenase-like predicted oxidoreductase
MAEARAGRLIEAAGTWRLAGDLEVHRMGFGAMRITGSGIWGPPEDRGEAVRVLRRAVQLGIDFIDTADSYGPDTSEELLAEVLHPYPKGLVIATKGGLLRPGPGEWQRDGRPERLRAACEGSLRRLRVERIDLYQLHAPDPRVPFEDSVGALADLRGEGKIRYVGLSNVGVSEIEQARAIVPIVSVQNRYNLGVRDHEAVLDYCEREGIAFLPWHPLGSGEVLQEPRVLRVAQRHGATPGQVSLAWLLARSKAVLPIPGTSKVSHLEENVGAASLRLSDQERRELEA